MTYQDKIKACNKGKKELTEWEKKFIADYAEKIQKYGDSTAFSDKQKACIDKIYDSLNGAVKTSKTKVKPEVVQENAGGGIFAEFTTETEDAPL